MRFLIKLFLVMAMMIGVSFADCGEKHCKHDTQKTEHHCMQGEACEKCTDTCKDCATGQCEKCKTGDCKDCKKSCHHGKHGKHHKKPHQGARYVAKVGDLEISQVYMRPTASVSMPTAAYLHIKNTGKQDDALLRVSSDVASKNEIHTSNVDDKGVMKMRKLEKLVLPAGEVTMLKPHGNHIMLMGTNEVLPKGAHIPLMLDFEKAGSKMVAFPVRSKAPDAEGCKHHKKDKKHDHKKGEHKHHDHH